MSGQMFPVVFSHSSCFYNGDVRFRNKTKLPSRPLSQDRLENSGSKGKGAFLRGQELPDDLQTGFIPQIYNASLPGGTEWTVNVYFWGKRLRSQHGHLAFHLSPLSVQSPMRPEKNLGGNNNPHFTEVVVYHLQNTVVSYVSL